MSLVLGLFAAMGLGFMGLGIVSLQNETTVRGFIMLICGVITAGIALKSND